MVVTALEKESRSPRGAGRKLRTSCSERKRTEDVEWCTEPLMEGILGAIQGQRHQELPSGQLPSLQESRAVTVVQEPGTPASQTHSSSLPEQPLMT
jgi:hypothetical protein